MEFLSPEVVLLRLRHAHSRAGWCKTRYIARLHQPAQAKIRCTARTEVGKEGHDTQQGWFG